MWIICPIFLSSSSLKCSHCSVRYFPSLIYCVQVSVKEYRKFNLSAWKFKTMTSSDQITFRLGQLPVCTTVSWSVYMKHKRIHVSFLPPLPLLRPLLTGMKRRTDGRGRGWEGGCSMAGIITSQNTRGPLSSATAKQNYGTGLCEQADRSCVPLCRHKEGEGRKKSYQEESWGLWDEERKNGRIKKSTQSFLILARAGANPKCLLEWRRGHRATLIDQPQEARPPRKQTKALLPLHPKQRKPKYCWVLL